MLFGLKSSLPPSPVSSLELQRDGVALSSLPTLVFSVSITTLNNTARIYSQVVNCPGVVDLYSEKKNKIEFLRY